MNIEESIVLLLVLLGIALAVFLIIRALMLWYWKVNVVVKNQERTNELLEKLFEQMGGDISEISSVTPEPEKPLFSEKNSYDLEHLKSNMSENELIIKSTETGEFELISHSQWDNDLRSGFAKNYEEVYNPAKK